MEVLQDGKYGSPEAWAAVIACEKFDQHDVEGCGAELQIEASDLVLRFFEGTHFRHYYTAARCPQCDKYTRVKDVPGPILRQVKNPKAEASASFDGFSESIY
jgi:hypothetical protein